MAKPSVTLPPIQYRRTPPSLLDKLLKPIRAPFKEILGGPALENCVRQFVDCGRVQVEFFLPEASFGSDDGYPDHINLAHDAFNDISRGDKRTQHEIIKLGISNWKYGRPRLQPSRFLPVPQDPYVIVTAYWQLERVKNDIALETGNTEMLEQYLKDDYHAYLESEGGRNWKIRARTQEEMEPRGWDQESIDEEIAIQLFDSPKQYERMQYNDTTWLRYNWAPRQNYPKALNYTCVLTPSVLLTVSFSLTEMTGASLKHWWSPLVEDSEILMQGVKLHYRDLPKN